MNVNDTLKKFNSGLIGIGIFLGVIILIPLIFSGTAIISKFLLPVFNFLSAISLLLFIFLVLPLSLIQKIRPFLATTSIIFSYISGIAVWMGSFLIIYYFLGWWTFFLFFIFQIVAPVAILGLLIQQHWTTALLLSLSLFFVYAMRFYGIWLATIYDKRNARTFEQNLTLEVKSATQICPTCNEKIDLNSLSCPKCGWSF